MFKDFFLFFSFLKFCANYPSDIFLCHRRSTTVSVLISFAPAIGKVGEFNEFSRQSENVLQIAKMLQAGARKTTTELMTEQSKDLSFPTSSAPLTH